MGVPWRPSKFYKFNQYPWERVVHSRQIDPRTVGPQSFWPRGRIVLQTIGPQTDGPDCPCWAMRPQSHLGISLYLLLVFVFVLFLVLVLVLAFVFVLFYVLVFNSISLCLCILTGWGERCVGRSDHNPSSEYRPSIQLRYLHTTSLPILMFKYIKYIKYFKYIKYIRYIVRVSNSNICTPPRSQS